MMTNRGKLQYGTPEYREYRQANRYGMSVAQLRKMLEQQDHKCKICNKDITNKYVIDHDPECCEHSAKKNTCGKCNRGALCQSCNLMVGSVENAVYENLLQTILNYIGEVNAAD